MIYLLFIFYQTRRDIYDFCIYNNHDMSNKFSYLVWGAKLELIPGFKKSFIIFIILILVKNQSVDQIKETILWSWL